MGLAEVARDLSDQSTVQGTLDRIVTHAASLVDGCTAASVMVVRRGSVETLAATAPVARDADRAQAELRRGPCFDAVVGKEQVYRLADTHDPGEWPELADRLRGLGIGSAVGFLLHANDRDNLGALNLFGKAPRAFTERAERVGWVVASHCAVALATAERDDALQRALRSSRSIGVAVGVLMARHGLTEDQAFDRLSRYSQDHNVAVRVLAEQVGRTGALPDS